MTKDELQALGLTTKEVAVAAKRAGIGAGVLLSWSPVQVWGLCRPGVALPVAGAAAAQAVRDVDYPPSGSKPDVDDEDPAAVEDLDVTNVRDGLLKLAREDFATFCEYVLRDEETGARIVFEELHERMCEHVDAHPFTLVMAHPESGKTNLLVVARVLFRLGKNPNLRIGLISAVRDNAKKNLGAIVRYIETSTALREVFPNLRQSSRPNDPWTTETITVERSNIMRDPSIQTLGVHGSVQGARLDEVYADDLLDYENTRTKALREDTSKWFRSTILARTERCVFLTNAWHPEDLSVELVKERGFLALTFPVLREDGTSSWPARWSLARIAARRISLGELEFARLFLCKPRDDGAQVFTAESIERCKKLGAGYGLVEYLDDALVHPEAIIVTGVDLAVTRRMKGAVSAMYTIYVHPNGMRQIIGARSGRWGARQILTNLADVADVYGGIAVVEDNGAQRYLVEIAQELDSEISIPVRPHTTGKNKIDAELGLDSMAAEYDAGRWIIPVEDGLAVPEIRAFTGELGVYDPSAHPGDRLMAVWMARCYILRVLRKRRAEKRGRPEGGVHASIIG